jgi:two-component system response regulator VicR
LYFLLKILKYFGSNTPCFFTFFTTIFIPLSHPKFFKMKNVLIIEDDKLISSLVQFKLKKEGYSVTMAEDGISGIDAINLMEADLIITDVMIPFKNGIEIINHARKVSPKVPIIVLSSLGEEESTVMEAFNLGVSDFVPKPFNPNELAMRVRRLINN